MDRITFTETAANLRTAAKAYYDTDVQVMTDAAYDDGIEQLRIAIAQNPSWAPEVADLLEQVAAGQSAGGDVAHSALMGSMDKANTLDAVTTFVARITGTVVVEPKLDGLAVAATYRNGSLVLLATRGDGATGEDVTDRAARITGLPTTITETGDLEVRGEVFMSDEDFAFTNTARTAAGKTAFVNARNGVAGTLRKASPVHAARMSFAAYEATGAQNTHMARMESLEFLGFQVAYRLMGVADVTATGPARVKGMIEEFGARRATAGFPTDGIVVKANEDRDRAIMGQGSRAPKWAIAYKFEAETATTVVQDIELALGRTGRLSLRARVTPVFVGGTTITYASAHSVSWLAEKDIRIGDTVVIERANDVIPYISAPVLDERPADSVAWVAPETCPQCEQAWDKSTLLWRCLSPECSTLGRIVYSAARDGRLDIEGLGVEVATALVESGKVTNVADLFDLTVADLAGLDMNGRTLGQANAAKIHSEIVKAKAAQFGHVLCSLGIRMTGRTMSRRLVAAYPTMDALLAATPDQLANVDGIGSVKAQTIYQGLFSMRTVIARLAAAGVNMGAEATAAAGDLPLAGMTIVVSGSVPGMSRTETAEAIEANGGKASSGVSATTSLLVADPSTSSKYVKAQSLGVRIVTPDEFLTMIGR